MSLGGGGRTMFSRTLRGEIVRTKPDDDGGRLLSRLWIGEDFSERVDSLVPDSGIIFSVPSSEIDI